MGGGFVYWVLCLISPPPGGKPYQKVFLKGSEDEALHGIDVADSEKEAGSDYSKKAKESTMEL